MCCVYYVLYCVPLCIVCHYRCRQDEGPDVLKARASECESGKPASVSPVNKASGTSSNTGSSSSRPLRSSNGNKVLPTTTTAAADTDTTDITLTPRKPGVSTPATTATTAVIGQANSSRSEGGRGQGPSGQGPTPAQAPTVGGSTQPSRCTVGVGKGCSQIRAFSFAGGGLLVRQMVEDVTLDLCKVAPYTDVSPDGTTVIAFCGYLTNLRELSDRLKFSAKLTTPAGGRAAGGSGSSSGGGHYFPAHHRAPRQSLDAGFSNYAVTASTTTTPAPGASRMTSTSPITSTLRSLSCSLERLCSVEHSLGVGEETARVLLQMYKAEKEELILLSELQVGVALNLKPCE